MKDSGKKFVIWLFRLFKFCNSGNWMIFGIPAIWFPFGLRVEFNEGKL